MGLKSAPHGPKAQLRERYAPAFRTLATVGAARDQSGAGRSETLALVDGNVVMMSVPSSITCFSAYVSYVYAALLRTFAAAAVTVVVFDEPESVSQAKRLEQRRRDAASSGVACSDDLRVELQRGDAYGAAALQTTNVQALKSSRESRPRLFDAVMVEVGRRLEAQAGRWARGGQPGGVLVLDGIDPRGADREGPREPRVTSTSAEAVELFGRATPVGEGDLKLAMCGRVARAAAGAEGLFKEAKIALVITIDTDSLAIELIEEARRADGPASPLNSVLCMRERAKKRAHGDEGEAAEACYTCVDVTMLHAAVQRDVWTTTTPSPAQQRATAAMLAVGFGACGCDFVELAGLRADAVLDSMRAAMRRIDVPSVGAAWDGDAEALGRLDAPIRALLDATADRLEATKKSKKHIETIRDPPDLVLRKLKWLAAYWHGHEMDATRFGFA